MALVVNRRLPQLGRIRIGRKGEGGRPTKLNVFRLTSQNKGAIVEAAERYGGRCLPWAGHEGHWEVVTTVNEIAIIVTPDPISQAYELWSAAGKKRRCDGETCQVPNGNGTIEDVPCMCDPLKRECGLKTRANFMLPDLMGVGCWRLDTGSYYAAAELPGQIELLQMARARNQFPEAILAIETRRYQRIQNGKPVTFTPNVVTIRFLDSIRTLLGTAPPPVITASVDVTTMLNSPQAKEAAIRTRAIMPPEEINE